MSYVAQVNQTTATRYPYSSGSGVSGSCNVALVASPPGQALQLSGNPVRVTPGSEAALMQVWPGRGRSWGEAARSAFEAAGRRVACPIQLPMNVTDERTSCSPCHENNCTTETMLASLPFQHVFIFCFPLPLSIGSGSCSYDSLLQRRGQLPVVFRGHILSE